MGPKTQPQAELWAPYRWPYKQITLVIALVIGVVPPHITARDPPCAQNMSFLPGESWKTRGEGACLGKSLEHWKVEELEHFGRETTWAKEHHLQEFRLARGCVSSLETRVCFFEFVSIYIYIYIVKLFFLPFRDAYLWTVWVSRSSILLKLFLLRAPM